MKIMALTDIHSKLGFVDDVAGDLEAADVVLLSGDITMFGRRDSAIEVLDAIRQYNKTVLAVMGNCDFPEVEEYLAEEGMCLHRNHKTLDGITFVGLGGSLACPMPTLNEWTEEQVRDHLGVASQDLPTETSVVLVSHQPPSDTVVDLAGIGKHVGSSAVRSYIEARQPLVCFSGHIHEAQGIDAIGETKLINPGPFMEGRYGWAEISDGTCTVEARQVAQAQ